MRLREDLNKNFTNTNNFLMTKTPNLAKKVFCDDKVSGMWQFLMVVAFIAFFPPSEYAVSSIIYNCWKILLFVATFVSVFLYILKNKITLRWFVLVLASFSYFFLSLMFGDESATLTHCAGGFCRIVGIATLLEYGLEKNEQKTLQSFLIAASIMCLINYISFIAYYDVVGGMKQGYGAYGFNYQTKQNWFFFTHDNGTIFYYLPFLAILWYYAFKYVKGFPYFAFLCTLAVVIMYIFLWSATAMVVTALFLIAMMLCMKKEIRKKVSRCNYLAVVFCGLAFCALVVFMNVSGSFEQFASIFQKSGTTNSRAKIWQLSIQYFTQNPLIGVGLGTDETNFVRIGINHCHNVILQLLYSGGIVATVFFALFLWLARPKKRVSTATAPLILSIFLIFVAQTFDYYIVISTVFVPFLVLAKSQYEEGEELTASNAQTFKLNTEAKSD